MSKLAVVTGALIRCAAGSAPSLLTATMNNETKVDGYIVAAIQDRLPGIHVKPFGTCAFTNKPCAPVTPFPWWPGETTVKLGGMFPVLDDQSILGCLVGGIIAVESPGQVFVNVNDERLVFKGDDDPPGFLFSLIPIVGPAAVAGYASGKGQKGAMWLNLGLAGLDAISLGTATLARGAGTAAARGLAAGARALFGGAARKLAAARAASVAARIFGRAASSSKWFSAYGGRSPRAMYELAQRRAQRFRAALQRHDGSFQRMRRALADESGFAQIGPSRGGGMNPRRMLGERGVQVTSKRIWRGKGKERIDVENPNPGQRPGQLHYQDERGNKYIYDPQTQTFPNAPASLNKRLKEDEQVQASIKKGMEKYLGEE